MYTMIDDASLAQKYKEGDNSAFEELYSRYVDAVYRATYMRTHHRQTAEDIVSTTFMQALESIGTFDPRRGSFSTWIHRIARNLTIDHFRAYKSDVSIEDAWDIPDDTDIPRDADTKRRIEHLRTHMRTFNASQREIILLRAWYGYPFAEIAEITGMKESACKMSYKRGIATLRSLVFLLLILSGFIHGIAF